MSGLLNCSAPDCYREATRKGAGLCEMHYYRLRRGGSTERRQMRLECSSAAFTQLGKDNAWLLGYLWADGCLAGDRVSVCSKDRDLLEQACRVFGGKDEDIRPKGVNAYELGYSSKKIAAELRDLGMTSRKSLTCRWPSGLAEELNRHFIRGVFDGDGSAALQRTRKSPDPALTLYICTASEGFAGDMNRALHYEGVCTNLYRVAGPRSSPIWYVQATNRQSIEAMANLMYSEGGPCLSRKKTRIAEWLSSPRRRPGNPQLVGTTRVQRSVDPWVHELAAMAHAERPRTESPEQGDARGG